jgi:hypothetical protein
MQTNIKFIEKQKVKKIIESNKMQINANVLKEKIIKNNVLK